MKITNAVMKTAMEAEPAPLWWPVFNRQARQTRRGSSRPASPTGDQPPAASRNPIFDSFLKKYFEGQPRQASPTPPLLDDPPPRYELLY